MYDNKNNKNNSQLNEIDVIQDVTQSKKKETFIVLYERYLLDGNLDLLDKLFYAFFVSLHCAGRVIDITNPQLREKIQVSPGEFISIDKVKRSLKKLEDMGYIKRYTNKSNGTRIITPVIKHEFDEIDESKVDVFYDRYGNEYRPIDKNAPRGKFAPSLEQICSTYNKDNIKENYIHNSQYIEPKKKKSYSDEFESFWSQSNKRGEKVKAYAAWKSHKLDGQVKLMIDLLQSNYSLKFGDREVRYQPHISTWINYRPWEEGAVKTEQEIIAKAHEQLQSTKNNLPAQINNIEPILSDLERFKNQSLRFGLTIKDNLMEAFLEALKSRNISIYQSNLEIIIEELQKMKFEGLDVNDCIKKFLLSSWKSFSIDYFQKKKAKRESLSNPFALHNQLKNKEK
jgi:DNA-binding MarR family transcriptional regulator